MQLRLLQGAVASGPHQHLRQRFAFLASPLPFGIDLVNVAFAVGDGNHLCGGIFFGHSAPLQVAFKPAVRKVKGSRRLTRRLGRKATLQVRSTKVCLKPTQRKHGDKLPPVELWAVGVFEIDPPQDQEPIEWFLLTSLPAETFAQAQRIIHAYAKRWLIEELHRILKSGCRVEQVNFRDSASLLPTVALYLIVAWRILYLRDFRRAQPDLCCSVFFTSAEWRAACLIQGRATDPDPPTLAQMVDMVGKMGGHMGRKSDPSPGPECLWRGMQKLRCYVEMGQALGKL